MAYGFMDRIRARYNVITNRSPDSSPGVVVISSSSSSTNSRVGYETASSVITPIKTRIAIDAAAVTLRHVRVDHLDRFQEIVQDELNDRLTIMANLDQSGTAFVYDAVFTMLDEGVCALVPVEVSGNPDTGPYEILSLRVATIVDWYNYKVKVDVYNEETGRRQHVILPKSYVAICYNPLGPVMNEPTSTAKRLVNKLSLLDLSDSKLYSPGLDLLLQMPFPLKNDKRTEEAERRLQSIIDQLENSKYGIGYIDPTEKITQLNRPVNNTLLQGIDKLTETLYAQLGLTPAIFSGEATDSEILMYNNRTILPILKSLTDGMRGAFFSRTAVRQGHSVMAIPDLFKMAPLADIAEASDKFTRNEIMSSNEVRMAIGLEPSKQEGADDLRNKNLNEQKPEPDPNQQPIPDQQSEQGTQGGNVNG